MKRARTSLAVALAALLAGCIASIDNRVRGHDQDGGATPDGGVVLGGSVTSIKDRCPESKPGAPVLRRLTRQELQNTIGDIFPEIAGDWGGVQLGPDPNSRLGFNNDGFVLTTGDSVAENILGTAEDVARLVSDPMRLPLVLPCSQTTPDASCALSFIDKYAPRLFRRPLTAAERTSYGAYHTSVSGRSNFAMGIKWTLVALLQSPHAIYRSELGDSGGGAYTPGQAYALSQYQIATELAYTYGGSTPSADLLAKAGRGELGSPDALMNEARQLLQTPRGQEVVREFFRQWLQYRTVADKVKTTTKDFDLVKGPMAEETRRFIDQVVFTNHGGVRDLLVAPYTVVNGALTGFYGFGAASTADYQLITRPSNAAIGILAQGSILAGNAQADRSSPTKRGLLVYEKLFCNERPQVPPNVPKLETTAPADSATTTRERFEKLHASSDFCKSCHTHFDPIGFGSEHFDEVGRFRANENGNTIDATGSVTRADPQTGAMSTVISFDGLADLATKAASLPEVSDCVGGFLASYAYGGVFECPAEDQRKALAEGKYGLVEYLVQLATAPHFVRRVP